ncbi:hypothetical protein M8J77_004381 [Diaphorina citri]|nr:hypothetical protein M8J77_004381 [Diaphorina citri]
MLVTSRAKHHIEARLSWSYVSLTCALILCCGMEIATAASSDKDHQITGSHIDLVSTFTNSLVPFMYKFLTNASENAVFSPFGLANNLAMMWDAAGTGKASEEILKAFRLDNYPSRQYLRKGFQTVISQFEVKSVPDRPKQVKEKSLELTTELQFKVMAS